MEQHDQTGAGSGSDAGSATGPVTHVAAETVDELGPGMSGKWEVHTRGSRHVWDLDAHTYARHPRSPRSGMPHDESNHPVTGVGAWPRVGAHSYVVFDDPDNPRLEQWRSSGTIQTITRARV